MMRIHVALTTTLLILCQTTIFSAEQTVKGKIKSVEVDKKQITLDDLELDVGRKTTITIDGKKGTLADLKAGQSADVKYDDELDAAFSITAITAPETNQTGKSDGNTTHSGNSGTPLVWDKRLNKRLLSLVMGL